MCAIRNLATTALSLYILHLCDDIAEGKRQNRVAHEKIKCPVSIQGKVKPNYSAHTGDVEQVENYASVDARKCLEPCVSGDR